jgi:type III secretory pathway component EscU
MTSLIFIMLFVARVIDKNARLRDLAMSTDCQRTERDAHGTPRMSQEMRRSQTRKGRLN